MVSSTIDRGRKAVDGAIELIIFIFLCKIHVCVSKGLPITSLWNVFDALAADKSIADHPVSNSESLNKQNKKVPLSYARMPQGQSECLPLIS